MAVVASQAPLRATTLGNWTAPPTSTPPRGGRQRLLGQRSPHALVGATSTPAGTPTAPLAATGIAPTSVIPLSVTVVGIASLIVPTGPSNGRRKLEFTTPTFNVSLYRRRPFGRQSLGRTGLGLRHCRTRLLRRSGSR
jgi:hypothetical protein